MEHSKELFYQNPLSKEFYPIYYALYEKHSTEMPDPQETLLASYVRQVIEDVIRKEGIAHRVRPDAKLFLLANLHEMFVLPLVKAQVISEDEVFVHLSGDTATILSKADELAAERAQGHPGAVLSGHIMLEALARSWDKLALADEDIWGDSEQERDSEQEPDPEQERNPEHKPEPKQEPDPEQEQDPKQERDRVSNLPSC